MSRKSRSRLAADWFAKLRVNAATQKVEHEDVIAEQEAIKIAEAKAITDAAAVEAIRLADVAQAASDLAASEAAMDALALKTTNDLLAAKEAADAAREALALKTANDILSAKQASDAAMVAAKAIADAELATAVAGATMASTDILTSIKTVDGSGSGLDADLLDGKQGSEYSLAHSHPYAPTSHSHTGLGVSSWNGIKSTTPSGYIEFGPANSGHAHIYTDRPNFYLNKDILINNSKVWHAGNDGSGSGLDADLLDGQSGAYYSPQSTTYTKAETDSAISSVVSSAPATLDTLNELAAALGDDPNFATTVATNIGNKADKSQVLTNVPAGAVFTDTAQTGYVGNVKRGSAYTLVLGNAGSIVEMNVSAANTVTIPTDASVAFPVDTRIDIYQHGSGKSTVVGAAGVVVRGMVGSRGQFLGMSLWKRATNDWVVFGGGP